MLSADNGRACEGSSQGKLLGTEMRAARGQQEPERRRMEAKSQGWERLLRPIIEVYGTDNKSYRTLTV